VSAFEASNLQLVSKQLNDDAGSRCLVARTGREVMGRPEGVQFRLGSLVSSRLDRH